MMPESYHSDLHASAGLSYLISEGLLPDYPPSGCFQWETYVSQEGEEEIEEEVLVTKHCVVWSRGQFVQNVYRFELEGEEVVQALLTQFSHSPPSTSLPWPQLSNESQNGRRLNNGHSTRKSEHLTGQGIPVSSGEQTTSSRALVVFLTSKAQIYFLHGATYILDLPVQIDRAFPAPRGVVIRRRQTTSQSLPPTPHVPAPPPNSFLSSQAWPSASFLDSPTIAKSFGGSQPSRPSALGKKDRLDALFHDVFGNSTNGSEEELAPLYSLVNPLSDFGVVTYSLQHQKPRLSSKKQTELSVEFEPLDPSEHVVYVSPQDELANGEQSNRGALMLIVTASNDLQTLTVWHAWYIHEKSLASLMRHRAEQKAAHARRRSSFLSANLATGSTTPAVRHREGTRESFAATGSMRAQGEMLASQPGALSSRKPTRQEEEDAMASQMDPDYHPTASQQNARESRRISSLNSDVRASQNTVNAAFGGQGARRNTSFGGQNERRSFGNRKSRGSTPGSVFSRSLGPDDDSMDIDGHLNGDGDESMEATLRHIRATFAAAGADSIFGGAEGDLKREIVVRKLHSVPFEPNHSSPSHAMRDIQVVTLKNTLPLSGAGDQRLNVYINDRTAKTSLCLHLAIKHRPLWNGSDIAPRVAIPLAMRESRLSPSTNIVKLRDKDTEALLFPEQGLVFSLDDPTPCPVPRGILTRAKNFGGRDLTVPEPATRSHGVQQARSPEQLHDRAERRFAHDRRVRLRPENRTIHRLLKICRLVLPGDQADAVLRLWHTAQAWLVEHPQVLDGTIADREWVAFATTVLAFVICFFDEKSRALLDISRLANVQQHGSKYRPLRQQQEHLLSITAPWRWIHDDSNVSEIHDSTQADPFLVIAATLAHHLLQSKSASFPESSITLSPMVARKLVLALHIFREEQKLCTLSARIPQMGILAAIIAQWGHSADIPAWSYSPGSYYEKEGACEDKWSFVKSYSLPLAIEMPLMPYPVGIFQWFEHALDAPLGERYPTLDVVAMLDGPMALSEDFEKECTKLNHRIATLSNVLEETLGLNEDSVTTVQVLVKSGVSAHMLETLPTGIAAPFKEAIARCEKEPPTTWPSEILSLVGRDDLDVHAKEQSHALQNSNYTATAPPRDVQTICNAVDYPPPSAKTKEANRHAVSQLIFNQDRRLVEATSLMHYNSPQVAECPKQPDWSDAFHLEQQRKLMQWVTIRMIALPAGDAMVHFDSQMPLLTDRYHLAGFSNSCLMQPMGHTMTTDRSGLTEERVNWAYFHAGVSAGLRISRNIEGIDTSWIAFNKPNDLTNRHAGLLLALGLNGHLKNLAKWLSFKYLTPKHTMTSVGLLLGLSASYMGTMDGLITRMLSVHITRMLPLGAAELNVSPITQTAGLMGIGLLYHNTQHRRMSEVMLSEVEHMELEDPDSGPDPLRDESYRLAAGLALGFINLGRGKDLRGLHGLHLPERLLAIAVGPRPVNAVHVFDRATAGAVIGIALVYMKSGDKAMAQKIDIPDTEAQFDHVRPDILLLRAMARHLILWDSIEAKASAPGIPGWIQTNLPKCYRSTFARIQAQGSLQGLKSSDIPFFNIATGLAWALSLKYAGSGNFDARDEILTVLDHFAVLMPGGKSAYAYTQVYNYDTKLARSTLNRCIDVLAVSAATVMAGTGDLKTFRYLRRLHGRIDPDTSYGSHFAAHLAIGVLFLGGGTYTFGTSDLAIASLICAFYPLYPPDVHDNHVHLQAFRHLWVFAAEARCLIVEDIDTQKPFAMPLVVNLKDGSTQAMTAPCLLPELNGIASVQTNDPAYWRVTLDFARNPKHLSAFKHNQRIFVRRCAASEAHSSVFAATLSALSENPQPAQDPDTSQQTWQSVFNLPTFADLDKADLELILPPDLHSSVYTDERGTVVDDRLGLCKSLSDTDRDGLWNLRVLFAWAERVRDQGEETLKWIGAEVVEVLKARVEERQRASG